ncbi:hypothetical protein FA95DRAFT_1593565 [Auriscalpium vulgare]|uniref:Uncharacterized protein n=1 Tax=Auriscalpium vulgare TaxID=40419 RepID=A0ACB8S4D4_9AGAM|nr:hypothetical protein FA95DRAFT_1593565 [Auriscalpium vulgare]
MIWCTRTAHTLRKAPTPLSRHFSFSFRARFPRQTRSLSDVHPPARSSIPSFREQVARASPVKSFTDAVRYPGVRGHILFFLGASLFAYGVAAQNTNVETDFWTKYLSGQFRWTTSAPSTGDMRLARQTVTLKKVQAQLNQLTDYLANAPIMIKSVVLHTYARVAEEYLNASEGRRAAWGICAVNVVVWAAWQIPRLRPFMQIHFTHNPLSGKTYTMLTSMFSHASFLHLLFNCMALTSFASASSTWMTREQNHAPSRRQEATATYHFLGFYLSAGLFSSLVSHVVATRFLYPRLVSRLAQSPPGAPGKLSSISASLTSAAKAPALAAAPAAAEAVAPANAILPSLGASGAIYGAVVLSAIAFPDAEVSLVFPPTPSFPIQYGVGGMVLLDCVGALRGWRIFDHYAHLGGAVFGGLYYTYGIQWWDSLRTGLSKPARS